MASYAILGTGAVGGLYGALLQRAGKEVHFLLRSDYTHVRDHGLRVDEPKGGSFHLDQVNAYARAEDMPRCDVAVVAWKATGNTQLSAALRKVLKPGGAALVLQNGLDPEREAAAAAPQAEVISGLCFLCARKEGPGHIRHQDYGAVTLAGYRPSQVTPRLREIEADFKAAGVEMRVSENWRAARWRKLVWNVPFNGLCALRGQDTRALLSDPAQRALVKTIMDEVLAGAAAEGCPLPADFPERMIRDTEKMIPYEPSMKLDRDAGREMELEAIYGDTLRAMAERGVRAERIEALYEGLRSLRYRSEVRGQRSEK